MKKFVAAAVICLALSGVSATASAADVMVCARNEAGLTGRVNITFYQGDAEVRQDSGWQTVNLGDQFCMKNTDIRAMNVTIEGWTTKWVKVCNENRRPAESLKVTMKGTLFSQSCEVF